MTYFNPHKTAEDRALSRIVHIDNLRFIVLHGSVREAARLARMPTETPEELRAARDASEAERDKIKARARCGS